MADRIPATNAMFGFESDLGLHAISWWKPCLLKKTVADGFIADREFVPWY